MSQSTSATTHVTRRETALLTKLNLQWTARYQKGSFDFGPLGVRCAGELFAEIRSCTGPAQDELLYGLLTAAHSGNKHAERVLVQVLIPAATRMAHRIKRLDEFDAYDRVGYAIGAAWEAIREYKMHRKARVHGNLTMSTLSLITPRQNRNDTDVADRTSPVPDGVLEEHIDEREEPAELQLLKLTTWAVDQGIVTADEVSFLFRVALGDETHEHVAESLGMTKHAVRHKAYRIRDRISAAVCDPC